MDIGEKKINKLSIVGKIIIITQQSSHLKSKKTKQPTFFLACSFLENVSGRRHFRNEDFHYFFATKKSTWIP